MQQNAAGGPPGLGQPNLVPLGQPLVPGSGLVSASSPSLGAHYPLLAPSRLANPVQSSYGTSFAGAAASSSYNSTAQAMAVIRGQFSQNRQLQEDVIRLVTTTDLPSLTVRPSFFS